MAKKTPSRAQAVAVTEQEQVPEQQPLITPESESKAKPASHDTTPPKALLDFMMQGWKPQSGKPTPKMKNAEVFAARRRELSKLFPGETLVIPTGHEKVRANDTYYRFRPGTD